MLLYRLALKGKRVSLCLLITLFSASVFAQSPLKSDPAKAKQEQEYLEQQRKLKQQESQKSGNPNVLPLYTVQKSGDLTIIMFKKEALTTANTFFKDFEQILNIKPSDRFLLTNTETDNSGNKHYKFSQYYKGVLVLGGGFLLHEKEGKLSSVNGKFYENLQLDVRPVTSNETAIKNSIRFVGAKKYKWENANAESDLKKSRKDPNATFYPKAQLLIAPKNGNYELKDFRLAYQVGIAAEMPVKKMSVFVDAKSGEIINNISEIAPVDAVATRAATIYSGQRAIVADDFNASYRLRESSLRPITTLNMLNKKDFSKAIDFTNLTNRWTSTASFLRTLLITKVNDAWKDIEDGNRGAPDIYLEIRDINDNLILGKDETYKINTPLPITINLNNTPLLTGSLYTVKVFDYDALSGDDLLGTFTFINASGSKRYTSDGTVCTLVGTQGNSGAIDAHWGIEKSYDYFLNRFGRRSYDNKNSTIFSYVHINKEILDASQTGNNAYWDNDENRMVFGDGDGIQYGSFTALDIVGHELTHGLINNNGNGGLTYQGESGALNESFADIFGTAIEFSAKPNMANWDIGENLSFNGTIARSLAWPKFKNNPDTYKGLHWFFCSTPTADNDWCGVHNNSGVQNKWFWLLSEGANGKIDDIGFDYKVPKIGMQTASKIAYINMMTKLSSNATYNDAYLMSLIAALDESYSPTTKEYRAIREAWFAVGVAKRPVITSFSPTTGKAGNTVIIKGTDFTGLSYLGFNEVFIDISKFQVNAAGTEITVVVPAGTTTGKIALIAGYDTVRTADDFVIGCDAPLTVNVTSTDAASFVVTASGGVDPYEYSLDNVTFQPDNNFTGLSGGRAYTVYVKDAADCKGQLTFFLNNPIQCNIQSGSGGQGTTFTPQILGTTAGRVTVSYQMYTIPDQMDIYYNNVLVASTGRLVSGTGTLTFDYTPIAGGPYTCFIRMFAPNSGTAWDFIAYCPVATPTIAKSVAPASEKRETGIFGEKHLQASLFPNPASNAVSLKLSGTGNSTMVILSDITGKELWRKTGVSDGNLPIPISGLTTGAYIVTIVDNNQKVQNLRLLKTKK